MDSDPHISPGAARWSAYGGLVPAFAVLLLLLVLPLAATIYLSLSPNVLVQFNGPGLDNFRYLLGKAYYLDVLARTEALLYAAARAQLVQQRLEPLLREGAVVLLDRFVDSSLAYQGAGRSLGVEQVRAINLFATAGLLADRTLLLQISPADGRARQRTRACEADRLERETDEFFARIAAAYEQLARAEPQRLQPDSQIRLQRLCCARPGSAAPTWTPPLTPRVTSVRRPSSLSARWRRTPDSTASTEVNPEERTSCP